MITLKLNTYTPRELQRLEEILKDVAMGIQANCCEDCPSYPARHLCYDFSKASEHVSRYSSEVVK